jgi:hypothetical protein
LLHAYPFPQECVYQAVAWPWPFRDHVTVPCPHLVQRFMCLSTLCRPVIGNNGNCLMGAPSSEITFYHWVREGETSAEGIWHRDKIFLQWCNNWNRVLHFCFWSTAINTFTSVFHCTGCYFLLSCFILVMNCYQRHYLYTFYLFCDGMSLNLGLIMALLFAVDKCVLNEAIILHMLQSVDVRIGGIL